MTHRNRMSKYSLLESGNTNVRWPQTSTCKEKGKLATAHEAHKAKHTDQVRCGRGRKQGWVYTSTVHLSEYELFILWPGGCGDQA